MKIPTSVVVDVVDAKPCRHGLIDFPNHAQISREKLAHSLISETVCIRVVERAVLDAAVARGERGAPIAVKSISRERGCAPLCNVWLPFSERVAGCDDEARVLFDDRVCVGDARIEIEAARDHVVAAVHDLDALGFEARNVLYARNIFVGNGIESGRVGTPCPRLLMQR